jgi:hypothetical protein
MTIAARLQITPAADQRGSPRRKLCLGSSLKTGIDVTIHDVSSGGLLIETGAELALFDGIEIELPDVGMTDAVIVWSGGRFYGCQFKKSVSQGTLSAALLRSPPVTPIDVAPLPERPAKDGEMATLQNAQAFEQAEAYSSADEDKAPLPIRLRVILGSAILLWTLILWGIWSLIKALR